MAFGNIAPFMALGPEQLGRTLPQKNVPPANYDPFANVVTVPQKPSNAMPMPYPSTTEARPLFDPFANTTITNSAVNQTPQPSGKQVRLPSGKIVTFPPNVPDDQILRDAMQLDQVDQDVSAFENQHPLAKGLQQLLGPQFGFQPPQPAEYKIPVVPGNTFGMTPQTLNNTLGIIQNTQNSNAAERIRQRVQIEQEMEREKDRAQQLKLEQQRLKNQQMMEKMRMQQEAQIETMRQQGRRELAGIGFNQEMQQMEKQYGLMGQRDSQLSDLELQNRMILQQQDLAQRKELMELEYRQGQGLQTQAEKARMRELKATIKARQAEGTGSGLTPRQAQQSAQEWAQMEIQALAGSDPTLFQIDPETEQRSNLLTPKGYQIYQQLYQKHLYGGGGGAGNQPTVGGSMPTTIDRDTGIVITD